MNIWSRQTEFSKVIFLVVVTAILTTAILMLSRECFQPKDYDCSNNCDSLLEVSNKETTLKEQSKTDFIIGNIVISNDFSQVLITDDYWAHDRLGAEGIKLYTKEKGKFELSKNFDVSVRDWEQSMFVNEHYIAFTYYPGKGPGGEILGIFDIDKGEYIRPNDIFSDLSEGVEYKSQDVLLPLSGAGNKLLLTFRTLSIGPDREPEEFEGFPGDEVVILDFDTMSTSKISSPNATDMLTPIGFSNDSHYALFENNRITLMSAEEIKDSWAPKTSIDLAKCFESNGYTILSLNENTLTDIKNQAILEEWIKHKGVSFSDYDSSYKRHEHLTPCSE